MKIHQDFPKGCVSILDLDIGDVFQTSTSADVYMLIEDIEVELETYNAIDLQTGEVFAFATNKEVIPYFDAILCRE